MPTPRRNPTDLTLRNNRKRDTEDAKLRRALERLSLKLGKVSIAQGEQEARLRQLERQVKRA